MTMPEQRIRALIERMDADRRTGEVLWRVVAPDGLDVAYGDLDRPFFIASASKLFTTACLAQLRDEGALDWDAAVGALLPDLDLSGLAVEGGRDVSGEITVREVMAHTAGLADYFEGRRPEGPNTLERALQTDFAWNVRDVVEWTRAMRPARRGRGLYSDTGFQLLGALIEQLDGRSFAESVQTRIATPLALEGTRVFTLAELDRFDEVAIIRNGDQDLRLPKLLASTGPDGGIVSTLRDGTAFLRAFFEARLFGARVLDEMRSNWHRIFAPFEYGTGVMRFRLPAMLTGFRSYAFEGHSGASGVVCYRDARSGVVVVGTVNQLAQRQLPYQLMIRTAAIAAR